MQFPMIESLFAQIIWFLKLIVVLLVGGFLLVTALVVVLLVLAFLSQILKPVPLEKMDLTFTSASPGEILKKVKRRFTS